MYYLSASLLLQSNVTADWSTSPPHLQRMVMPQCISNSANGWPKSPRSPGSRGQFDASVGFDAHDMSLIKYMVANFSEKERRKMCIVFHDGTRGCVREQFFTYLAQNWKGFILHHENKVAHCVRQGVPDHLRGLIWQHMVDSKVLANVGVRANVRFCHASVFKEC